MSRSYRHTAITGMCGGGRGSEKQEKRLYNRSNRHTNKQRLDRYEDNTLFDTLNDTVNVWSMSKDGKMIFDPKKYPKGMRK